MRPNYTLLHAALGTWSRMATALSNSPSPGLKGFVPPKLPDRSPFGFGVLATGGGTANENNTYVVDNMPDLRAVLKMDKPRIVYVRGEIRGNQINETFAGNCQYYIDSSSVPNFNFTLYIMALNATYTNAVKAAVAVGELFEGRNATEYLALLNRQNGWRGTAQNVQKSWESIDVRGNLTLIGMDSTAYLNSISLNFNTRTNIIIRNLHLTSPRDCFPSPETWPSSWNARYDAISFVTTTNAWLDGNTFSDPPPSSSTPDPFNLWGWQVDRYDGLFDVEDGSDNITFSHNIVTDHHKSLLFGGGEKEGPRDLGKMRFTLFANHFVNSVSRNPLMRFGTFYIVNNVFSNYQNKPPLYVYEETTNSTFLSHSTDDLEGEETNMPNLQYNLGVYNMSSVLVSGNFFSQTGTYAEDQTRIFTFQNLATPSRPATFCSPPDLSSTPPRLTRLAQPPSTFNGKTVNLTSNIFQTFEYYLGVKSDSVAGGLVQDCAKFEGQSMPAIFDAADEVFAYVSQNAGQVS